MLAYEAVVALCGTALFLYVLRGADPFPWTESRFWVLAGCTIAGEFVSITLAHRKVDSQLTPSSCFAVAMLLMYGVAPAVIAVCLGSLLAGIKAHRPARWTIFNMTEYALSLGAAGVALTAFSDIPRTVGSVPFTPADMAWIALAAVVLFVVNTLVVWGAIALESGVSVVRQSLGDPGIHAYIIGLTLGLAPIVVLALSFSPVFLVLLALPLVAAQQSMREATHNEYRALHDALTDLPNRTLFGDRVDSALDAAGRRRTRCALMLIDLDGFKELNDTHGHGYGDEILRQVAKRVRVRLRASDTVARLGGDEFGVLLPDVASPAAAVRVAHEISRSLWQGDALGEPGARAAVRASIGVAVAPDHGRHRAALLEHADLAMYRAKERGVSVEVYVPELSAAVGARGVALPRLAGA